MQHIESLDMINDVYSALKMEQFEEAAQKFVDALKRYEINERDHVFSFFDKLSELDVYLNSVDRETFWQNVDKDFSMHPLLHAQDIDTYLKIIRRQPPRDDKYRVAQLFQLPRRPWFQFLLAKSLANEGSDKSLQQASKMLKEVALKVHAEDDRVLVANLRGNVLNARTSSMSFEEGIKLIDGAFEDGWANESFNLRNHMVTRRSSLKEAIELREQFANTAKKYETRFLEMLTLFTTVVSLSIGGLGIVRGGGDLHSKLTLLLGLCLCLGTLFSFLLAVLRSWLYMLAVIACIGGMLWLMGEIRF